MMTLRAKIDQKTVGQFVKTLRQEIVEARATNFINSFDTIKAQKRLANSFLSEYIDVFPGKDPLETLTFSLELIEHGIDHLIRRENDPRMLLYSASKLVELCHQEFINPRDKSKIKYLGPAKSRGFFFTPPEVAEQMALILLTDKHHEDVNILDPAGGMGVLAGAAMIVASESQIHVKTLDLIELDVFTSVLAEKILSKIRELKKLKTKIRVYTDDALDFLTAEQALTYDYIITNPPYGRIKFLKSSLINAETKTSTSTKTIESQEAKAKEHFKKQNTKISALSVNLGVKAGLNDYYRVFLLLCLNKLSLDGRLVAISPNTWLGDKDSYELRKMLITNKWIKSISMYPESSGLFATVNQSTVVTLITKSPSDTFTLSLAAGGRHKREVSFESIVTSEPELLRIPKLKPEDVDIFNKLKLFPTISQRNDILCRRGEIDMSLDKGLFTQEKTKYRLVKGSDIERFTLDIDESSPFISASRSKAIPATYYRIAGRQISYIDKKRRLSFAIVPPGASLGNSCNYLALNNTNEVNNKLLTYTGILNSVVLEWYFRTFNSNNHVANFEINTFPIPDVDTELLDLIARSTEFLIHVYSGRPEKSKDPNELEDFQEALIAYAYKLTSQEIKTIVDYIDPKRSERIANMLTMLHEGISPRSLLKSDLWHDHYPPTLSDLDRQMISYIPQGGNWSSIPDKVPSQRVAQIKEMSKERGIVRTTYYGRLRPDQPSYTIATSFNRPGNGTNIHPWEDRTITAREAARLQSFPDSYMFLGNEGAVRTQIGNAVPPLLGYAVGKQIAKEASAGLSVDAFAGAGGLSIGLEMAGFESICGLDNDKPSAQTYRFNRPSSEDVNAQGKCLFIEGDLSDPDLFQESIDKIKIKLAGRPLQLLAGGPPCQGFSHAGFRRKEDKRNDLASIYLKMAEQLQPETVLLENVEGLLSFNKGQVIKDLLQTLSELGYKTAGAPWVLCAEEYGVPQMRRRVFIVVNKNKVIEPPQKLYQKCLGRKEEAQLVAPDSLGLPYPHTAAEALNDLSPTESRRIPNKGQRPIRIHFSEWLKGFANPDEMLSI